MALMTQVGLIFTATDRSRGVINSYQRSFASLSRTVLSFAGVGGAGYLLQRVLRGSVAEASKAQETFAKFDVVFRNQAAATRKWAEEYGDSVGRATHEVAGWLAGLQDTFVPLGIARDKAAELSKSLVQLAVDVASFNNKADADVIRDFTSALVGNHETVRKYGIIISESAIKQEALNKGLNKTYKELTDLEKVQLRYSLIQKGSTDAQGDALRTADSYANQVKRLKANLSELEVTLGNELLPILTDLVAKMNEFMQQGDRAANIIGRISDATKSYMKWYGKYMGKTPGGYILDYLSKPRETTFQAKPEQIGAMPSDEIENLNKRLREVYGSQNDLAKNSNKTSKSMIANARDYIDSVRHMDYLTRQERIANLEAYRDAHKDIMFDVVGNETEAGEAIRKEIEAIRESRTNAMKIYAAELREDMQNTAIYISEKFAEASKSIESSLSGAIYSMIADGQSFREVLQQLFIDIGNAFARMVADMIARWLMFQAISSFGGGFGGFFGGGAPVPTPAYPAHHAGWIPDTLETYHGGRKMMGNEHLAVIENDELVVPPNKVRRVAGSGGQVINQYITIKALDTQDVRRALHKEKDFINDLGLIGLKSNHAIRRIDK